jgi:hypothetical protein
LKKNTAAIYLKNGEKRKKLIDRVMYDECTTLPKSKGNGQLVRRVSVDKYNKVTRYSLAYINHSMCHTDNGRVLGYDNAHGYHHKHYLGKIEAVKFVSYEKIEEQFQQEFEVLYAQN